MSMDTDTLKRVDLEGLAEYLDAEKGSDALQPLPYNFYNAFDSYYEKLQQDFIECPDRKEREFLGDELRGAQVLYEALIDKRMNKMIGYACLNMRPPNALPEELVFYDQLHELFVGYKDQYLSKIRAF